MEVERGKERSRVRGRDVKRELPADGTETEGQAFHKGQLLYPLSARWAPADVTMVWGI